MSDVLLAAVEAMRGMGATDSVMAALYKANPQVRQIVDANQGKSIDDLLRGVGVDPAEARRALGINLR